MQRHIKCAFLSIQIQTRIQHLLNQKVFFFDWMEFLEKYTFNLPATSPNSAELHQEEINRTRITSQKPGGSYSKKTQPLGGERSKC